MKIAFTSQGTDLDAVLDTRFGRAENFIIIDTDSDELVVVPNSQNLNAPQGAGIQAATTVAASGANIVITGHCGPKAFRVLETADIKVYTTKASTVKEALNAFNQGTLEVLSAADVEGHWA